MTMAGFSDYKYDTKDTSKKPGGTVQKSVSGSVIHSFRFGYTELSHLLCICIFAFVYLTVQNIIFDVLGLLKI